MTLPQAADESGLDRSGIARACRDGTIKGAQQIGKLWTFPRKAWEDWRRDARRGNPNWRAED